MARHKRAKYKATETHQDLSYEGVHTLLDFFGIPDRDFDDWIQGQTCPILPNGKMGFFWWDVKRFIDWKTRGVIPIWD